MSTILYFIICFLSSIIGSITGIGGGIMIKPLFDLSGKFSMSNISFYASTTVLSMAIMSLYLSRKGEVRIRKRVTIFLGIGGALGGVLGKSLFSYFLTNSTNPSALSMIQNILLLLSILMVLIYILIKQKLTPINIAKPVLSLVIGFLLGSVSSFIGIGGGPFNIMVLSFFYSMDSKNAALNSLYIILFSQIASMLISLITKAYVGIDLVNVFFMAFGGLSGAYAGRMITKKINSHQLDILFIIVLCLLSLLVTYNIFR